MFSRLNGSLANIHECCLTTHSESGRSTLSTQARRLYDHHRKHVGKIEIFRRTSQAYVTFKPETHYANTILELDEVEQYMKSFGFMYEEDLNQITFEDLL